MSGREAILNKVRAALVTPRQDTGRSREVAVRLAAAPTGVIPARAQLPPGARLDLFRDMAQKILCSVEQVQSGEEVPGAVAAYLRARNLPAAVRMGADPRLAAMPWGELQALEVKHGASDGLDEVGVSHAFGAIAETGTVAVVSGPDNPTTINFLPDHHLIVVQASDVTGDLESLLGKVRDVYGKGEMPRTLNLISGPSRSGDIEQKMILGAHGPRALHLILVGEA